MKKRAENFLIFILVSLLCLPFGFPFVSMADTSPIAISQDSSVSSIGTSVAAGSNSSDFNIIKIQNNSSSAAYLTWIKVTGGSDAYGTVSIYQVDGASRTQLGSSQSFFSGAAFFSGFTIAIPMGSFIKIAITASVLNTVAGGTQLGLTVSADGVGIANSNGNPFDVTGSPAVLTRTVVGAGPDTVAPGAVTGLKAESTGDTPTIKLSWEDPADTDLEKVDIYRSISSTQAGSLIKTLYRGVGVQIIKYYDDTNITVGTTYYYTVKTVDIAGNQSAAATANAMVYPKGLNIVLDTSSPSARTMNASTSNNVLAVFKLISSNVESNIYNIQIAGQGNAEQMGKLELKVGSEFVASSTGPVFQFYPDVNAKLYIGVNQSKLLTLSTDFLSLASGGYIKLKFSTISASQTNGVPNIIYGLGLESSQMTIVPVSGASPSPSPSASPSPSPSVSPSPTPSPSANSTRELIRSSDGRVYKIVNGKRVWIPTAQAFIAQGFKWENVQNISDSEMASYVRSKLIQVPGDPKVYYLTESGLKRHIPSAEIFLSYQNRWEDILQVDSSILNSYPDNALIKLEGDVKVYKLENGKKRWIKTAAAFNRLKLNWSQIAPVNATELNSYLTGANIQ